MTRKAIISREGSLTNVNPRVYGGYEGFGLFYDEEANDE